MWLKSSTLAQIKGLNLASATKEKGERVAQEPKNDENRAGKGCGKKGRQTFGEIRL